MNSTSQVRDSLVSFLRREIIGPDPGYPVVQVNGDEILRSQNPPVQRYGAGILFPAKIETQGLENDGTDAESGDADNPDADGIVEAEEGEENSDYERSSRTEIPPESDQEINKANEYLPSAMGLSAMVLMPEELVVTVSAGFYRKEVLIKSSTVESESNTAGLKGWYRYKIEEEMVFQGSELVGEYVCIIEKPVVHGGNETGLYSHIVSRPDKTGRYPEKSRLITVTLINRKINEIKTPKDEDCFFQCGFSVRDKANGKCFLSYPEMSFGSEDNEQLSMRLLYRHRKVFSIGHGCSADWNNAIKDQTDKVWTDSLPTHEIKPILPRSLESLELSMLDLSSEDIPSVQETCRRLSKEYLSWIEFNENLISNDKALDDKLKITAENHTRKCRECFERIQSGIDLLSNDEQVAKAFRLMNRAMMMQQIHYDISSRKIRKWKEAGKSLRLEAEFANPSYDDRSRTWRPFQLAFILMNLPDMACPDSEYREVVDLIWFPTGGGKTEAYLGLAAFSVFLRRLYDRENAGTSVLMRYTLRLLSTQQFQRAASLICACEVLRLEDPACLGDARFSIGLWVGGEVTPNSEEAACNTLRELNSGQGINKFIVLSCPWCGSGMGPYRLGRHVRCKGYRQYPRPKRVRLVCEDPSCRFSDDESGLPLQVIDEHIYQEPPTILIGTVDKFAMLPFRPEARTIFGINTSYSSPDLIIQDELHLISGPLGSMVGHYETIIDALCNFNQEGHSIAPKIISSTATIARADEQINNLYGREAFMFPPQGLRAGDSFFAEEREDQPGRLYVGVLATGLHSHVSAQVRTLAALFQSVKELDNLSPAEIDPYWTVMGYFNSLRELGHAATLIRADIREYLNAMWDRKGLRPDLWKHQGIDHRRFINKDLELTSRVSSSKIPEILQQLFQEYNGDKNYDAIDVCFATNMIQVGLDVPRLSLMTIIGQPKTTSEYIQASSRVGRELTKPGLVVTNFNQSKPRDRSHYEHFKAYHQNIYWHVEPTSVTPFAIPVRDRALHALIIILCRFLGDSSIQERPDQAPDEALQEQVKDIILARVKLIDNDEYEDTRDMIIEIFKKWSNSPPPRYGGFGTLDEQMPLMYPAGTQQHPFWGSWPFATPTSMRNVDSECEAQPLRGGYEALDE